MAALTGGCFTARVSEELSDTREYPLRRCTCDPWSFYAPGPFSPAAPSRTTRPAAAPEARPVWPPPLTPPHLLQLPRSLPWRGSGRLTLSVRRETLWELPSCGRRRTPRVGP